MEEKKRHFMRTHAHACKREFESRRENGERKEGEDESPPPRRITRAHGTKSKKEREREELHASSRARGRDGPLRHSPHLLRLGGEKGERKKKERNSGERRKVGDTRAA